jgi:uncharacterized protein (TIGR03067 family)
VVSCPKGLWKPVLAMKPLPLLLMAVCCLSPAEAAGDAPARAEVNKLQGVWRPVKLERAGQTVADTALPGARFVVKGDTLLFKAGDSTLLDVRFRVNPSKTPAEIDLTCVAGPTKGSTIHGIYRLKGKRLTLCWPLGEDQPRPTAFDARAGADLATLTLERD